MASVDRIAAVNRKGRRVGLGLGVAAALALAALALRLGHAVTLSLSLALPAGEAWFGPVLAEATREEIVVGSGARRIAADLYRPAEPRGALVLVHGLSRAGRRQADLVRLARLLARHGQLVLVPEIQGLVEFTLSGREVEDIRAALRALAARGHAVGIAGFSFGAGPTLLAAADAADVRLVASFGGYADLRNVITFVTTGVHTHHGQRHVQPQEEYNRWKLLALLAGFLERDPDRGTLAAIAARRLANPATDTRDLEAALDAEGRATLRLVLNRDEGSVPGLLAALPPGARGMLERLSPLASVPRLRGRLLIAHGAADDSIPFTESLRLAEAAEGRARLVILHTFHHTGVRGQGGRRVASAMEDAWSLVRLADALLDPRAR